jgi:hypothetical protein
MAKIDYTLISFRDDLTSADVDQHGPSNSGTALELRQYIDSLSAEVVLVQTADETGDFDDGTLTTEPGIVDIGDQAWLTRPKEKVNVEGAVQAFTFFDGSGTDIGNAVQQLLPAAPNVQTLGSTAGSPARVGTSAASEPINTLVDVESQDDPVSDRGAVGTGTTTVGGDINFDVAAAPSGEFDADSFGRADEGELRLIVNGSQLGSSINLTNLSAQDGTSGGAVSGINVSAATNVSFPGGSTFGEGYQRTGTWLVDTADFAADNINTVKVQHLIGGSLFAETNTVRYFYDIDVNVITITPNGSGFSGSPTLTVGRKNLSGVEFAEGASAELNVQLSNVYRTSYSPDSGAIFYTDETNLQIPDVAIPNANSVTDDVLIGSGSVAGANNTSTFTATTGSQGGPNSVVNGDFELRVNVQDPVESTVTSSLLTANYSLLIDNLGLESNPDLENDFIAEQRRVIESNVVFSSANTIPSSAVWDGTQSIADTGPAGYNDGLQVIASELTYPDTDFSSSQPVGNPDYTGETGQRTFVGYFTDSQNTSDFALRVSGTGTLTTLSNLTNGSDDVAIEVRIGGDSDSGWLDVNVDESVGGAFAAANGNNKAFNGNPIGITLPNFSGSPNAGDKLFYRITFAQASTAVLQSVDVDWAA